MPYEVLVGERFSCQETAATRACVKGDEEKRVQVYGKVAVVGVKLVDGVDEELHTVHVEGEAVAYRVDELKIEDQAGHMLDRQ